MDEQPNQPKDVQTIKDPPQGGPGLKEWLLHYTGVRISECPVCRHHHAPWDYFEAIYVQRPPLALVLGPRGGGKSFLAALGTHLTSRWYPNHGTRILGGSRAQSEQVYRALREVVYLGRGERGSDSESIAKLFKNQALYRNGSEVAILSASPTSVRGPHVPTLFLDEVDEIDTDIREAAMGMCMFRHGAPASAVMTSTCHRVNGPMSQLIERASAGDFPLYTFCVFEVLEKCSDSRSGPWVNSKDLYLNCHRCPIQKWCHAERDLNGNEALAKRSGGHYAIDSLIQKVRATSARTFEADYLCKGPKSDGLWFPKFDPARNVAERAEFDRALPVQVAVDSGVFTGAVLFQISRHVTPTGLVEEIHLFADYLAENRTAEQNARAILEKARTHCEGRFDCVSTDPAGGSRNPIGPTVIAEYERAGLRPLRRWPQGTVADGLALIESFLEPAAGHSRLIIHPRCEPTIRALKCYRRAKRGGQWQDYPEDPQHPHEDLVDALRGGLRLCYPEGRTPPPNFTRISARKVF